MYDKEINSKYLNETKILKIYEPESLSTDHKYNICMMQDGNDYYQLGRIATLSDKLHETADITNTIFVGIHYIDKEDRRKKYHPDGVQYDAYVNFLVEEVVPFIDQLLPTNPFGTTRALMGDSLAGTIALMTSISYPELFEKVVMQSPFVDQTILTRVNYSANDLSDVYHTIGLNETAVPTSDNKIVDFVTPNRELHDLLQMKTENYIYHEINEGDHTWKYWQKDLPHILKTMFN